MFRLHRQVLRICKLRSINVKHGAYRSEELFTSLLLQCLWQMRHYSSFKKDVLESQHYGGGMLVKASVLLPEPISARCWFGSSWTYPWSTGHHGNIPRKTPVKGTPQNCHWGPIPSSNMDIWVLARLASRSFAKPFGQIAWVSAGRIFGCANQREKLWSLHFVRKMVSCNGFSVVWVCSKNSKSQQHWHSLCRLFFRRHGSRTFYDI